MSIYCLKVQNLGGQRNPTTFQYLKNQHFSVQQMANQWLIRKSKPKYVEHPMSHLWTNCWSDQWISSTLLAAMNVLKNVLCFSKAHSTPLNVLHPPENGTII